MKGLYAALWAESLKVRRSKMLWITLLAFAFVAVMMGLMVLVSRYPVLAGQSTMVSAKASMFQDNWPFYLKLLIQIILSLGTIGFGIVSSWVFGREYIDRVATDLLALPIHRSTLVLSKFIIVLIWSFLLSFTIFVFGLLTGLAVNIPGWSVEITYPYFILFVETSLLTIMLCTPVAFIASFSRGYLAPIGYVISTLIITNIVVLGIPIISSYVPWAIPALITGVVGPDLPSPGVASYIILASTSILGLIGTVAWWRFADQT
jgi:ABC-2 type transport system permease protein